MSVKGRFEKSMRSAWIASFALALWAAGCVDEPGVEDADPAPGLKSVVESQAELAKMEAYVADQYDRTHVVHTFTQPSGDVVDCVRREGQPGLRKARGRALATPPTFPPVGGSAALASHDGMEAFLVAGQKDANGVARSCPDGTVPIRRLNVEDVARFRTLDDMHRKHPGDAEGIEPPRLGPSSLHQYAGATQSGLANQGAHTRINIWNPYVESATEFSLSQLWVIRGSGSNLQTLEAGWQKYPNLYGTWQPHLFIYSTSDGYGPAGCYNLSCGRFIQVDGSVVIGGALPASVAGGAQYELEAMYVLWQGNWWFGANGVWVGYYPGSLFNAAGLLNGADRIDFGDEIIDDRVAHPGRHTLTDAGSGQFPSAWWLYAQYQRDIWYWTDPGHSYYMTGLTTFRSDSYCYDVSLSVTSDPTWHTFMFMGGSGYNANCM